jgi:hypothetical protein
VRLYNLKNSTNIRRLFAAFFLLLFSFCVTPKRFLHDMLANHLDAQTSAGLPVQQIASSGFHCHIDDLVVVAPFMPDIQSTVFVFLSSSPVNFSEPFSSIVLSCLSDRDSRGPPANFCS